MLLVKRQVSLIMCQISCFHNTYSVIGRWYFEGEQRDLNRDALDSVFGRSESLYIYCIRTCPSRFPPPLSGKFTTAALFKSIIASYWEAICSLCIVGAISRRSSPSQAWEYDAESSGGRSGSGKSWSSSRKRIEWQDFSKFVRSQEGKKLSCWRRT